MQSSATTVDAYISTLPEDRKEAFTKLRKVILMNLPKGFSESMNGGMINYVVPHSVFPQGYHCNPSSPLPFIGIASQKNFIALYHMGMYADPKLLDWFTKSYAAISKTKLDMGKSCVRFKKPENIPFELIADLASKMTAEEWIKLYLKNLKR